MAAEALKFAKRRRIHTGIGTSWYHIHEKLNSTPDEIVGRAVEAVKYARRFVDDVDFTPKMQAVQKKNTWPG